MSYGIYHLRRGVTYDPECSLSTHRLRRAFAIAESTIGGLTWKEHAEDCERHPKNLERVCFSYRERVCCTCGKDKNPIAWPTWVDDEVLSAIWELACQVQTKEGAFNRNKAAVEAKRLTGPKSKLLFNDEGFEEHPDTDAAWLRGRL